ncbi:hypothetical protein [Stenotrophomonas sp. ATs4]|uniref:hypothetical protein n=1 Tax=Stenotrophomonas sp. ATs4 TaxID=3402766 RepID=UPI003F70FDFD
MLLWCLLLPTSTWAATPVDAQLREMDREMLAAGASDRVEKLVDVYSSWESSRSSEDDCGSLSDLDIEAAFRASFYISMYVGDEKWLGKVRCIHAELGRRGIATETTHRKMHSVLVQVRHFAEANELREVASLRVDELPEIERNAPDQQGTLHPLANGKLEWRRWKYRKGLEVVVYVSPACAPSRRAMHVIMNEPEWTWILSSVRFVVRRSPAWPHLGVSEWNKSNPSHPMLLQAGPEGWKEMDVHETPVFHVFRNGLLLRTLTGWADASAGLMSLKESF